ncbi:amino acid permease [Pseudobacteriovorax antillogorgiicola]|uniref:Ethanolamine:proton symporter, EAT family n=1 Tax=Pseudobacteriovorax antillogorgiicola TaxID=1513793 RepID=A0A1Y6C9T9_9BACT|nr:amino acid permease [Pseudobacteriovorax antillogorgiicola]TCS49848.1 ethanolamine:proton symporter (EAT family) [Pseudobacteriovorax antillogorgiicola]SMF43689.1 ethanolamine:proton symporter, EAT family [Pseudobacteriovorax antillogorgiicola]
MDKKASADGVVYQHVDKQYFESRTLKRYAGVWSLWALGVGAVISGDFFGWNFGLAAGGFGGLLIATIIITIMYVGLGYSIAEMTATLPHTGGAYSFGRTAMGPWGGFITGLAENMEYVLTPAVIVIGIGGYFGSIANSLLGINLQEPVWWTLAYLIFVGLNIRGVEMTFRFSVIITMIALSILLVFWIGAIPLFSFDQALNIPATEGHSSFLPFGISGIMNALPFAIWFYLAIEQLPLAAEESHQPSRDIPKGMLWGLLTLVIAAFLTLFLNAGISPGAAAVGASDEPLFLAFTTIFGPGIAPWLALIAVAGLVASFHTIIYAYGRNIYSLSRAGYFPRWLSVTGPSQTPKVALIAGATVGFVIALIIKYAPTDGGIPVGPALLNMAVFGALIAYVMQLVSFIILRKKFSHLERPFKSPLGIVGAGIALLICVLALVFLLMNEEYRVGIWGCAAWIIVGTIWFALRGKTQLVFSPEEEFAFKARESAALQN